MINYLEDPNYEPNRLVDEIRVMMGYKSDSQLAAAIGRNRSQITLLRKKKENLSAGWILDFHDLTGYSAEKLRDIAGVSDFFEERRTA